MGQMTWRADDELLHRVRLQAQQHGRSLNEWVTTVLAAASDPSYAGSDADRIRERLARAGLLEQARPAAAPRRPSRKELAEARSAAGQGRAGERRAPVTVFADSSALVKLYADEADADLVRAARLYVVAAVARVEVPAAIWRKHRMAELSAAHAAVLTRAFEADWYDGQGPFVPVALGAELLADAAGLVVRHGLRAYDGVQLACAVAARAADAEIDTLLCFDADLSEVAAREGFRLAA